MKFLLIFLLMLALLTYRVHGQTYQDIQGKRESCTILIVDTDLNNKYFIIGFKTNQGKNLLKGIILSEKKNNNDSLGEQLEINKSYLLTLHKTDTIYLSTDANQNRQQERRCSRIDYMGYYVDGEKVYSKMKREAYIAEEISGQYYIPK